MSRFRTLILSLALSTGIGCSSPGGDGAATSADATQDTGNVGGTDAPVSCVAGRAECDGPDGFRTCNADGTDWIATACPAESGCTGASCVPWICIPGATVGSCLTDTSHEACNASGTAFEVNVCGAGETCRQGICAGQLCVPGERVCAGFIAVQECDTAGSGFTMVGNCPAGGSCAAGVCLTPCEVNIKNGSYLGCEYWAVDLDNVEEAELQQVGVAVSVPPSNRETEVIITNSATNQVLSAGSLGVSDLFVMPGQVKVFRLPTGFDIDGSRRTTNTFKLVTTSPVTMHQFNPLNGDNVFSNDASLLLPAAVTGQDYFVMAWPHRVGTTDLRGFVTIVATQAGSTQIEVTPTASVAAGPGLPAMSAGLTHLFELVQGEAINLETDGAAGGDLTGTVIHTSQRASVIAGHECANVPNGISFCDHIEQQLFPLETWGNRYVAASFAPRSAEQIDVWRVMAGDNDITVTTNPPVPGYGSFKLQRGGWLQFAAAGNFAIEADGPILVGHYMTGSNYPGADKVCGSGDNTTGLGDPAFTLAVPTTRFLSRYAVLTPDGYQDDWLNIVARPNAAVTFDGAPISQTFTPVGDSGFALARVPVEPGVHVVESQAPFGLTAYGYDCDVSYAYPGGLQLQASSTTGGN